MSHGHQSVQDLQEELVMHPYFNPILLFKKYPVKHSGLPRVSTSSGRNMRHISESSSMCLLLL
jgi:hypothetical protein